jgi:hypothetical protein
MTIATLIVYGRYWYDFLAIAWIVGFFLIEMLLLFRSSLIGWAMTMKCLVLAGVFGWAMMNPPPLVTESVTQEKVVTYTLLITVLGYVIFVLLWMRYRRLTVVVGKLGDGEEDPRYFPAADFIAGRKADFIAGKDSAWTGE